MPKLKHKTIGEHNLAPTSRQYLYNPKHVPALPRNLIVQNAGKVRKKDSKGRDIVGSAVLETIKPLHRHILALHLSGWRNTEIAARLNVTAPYVSMVLNHPRMEPYLEASYGDMDMELRGLTPLAIDAIRSGLTDDDTTVKLKASDQYWRTQRKYSEQTTRSDTAEDVIRRVLQIKNAGEITIIEEERRS